MMFQKGWVWMTFALVCAISAAAIAFVVLQQQTSAAAAQASAALMPTPIPMTKMPVAARNLPIGTVLAPADITIEDFPSQLVTGEAITHTEALEKQVLIAPISKGDIFRPSTLRGDEATTISGQIEAGKTLIGVPASDIVGQSGVIHEGDHIDLLLSVTPLAADGSAQAQMTGYTVQNARVFRVLGPPKTEQEVNPKPTGFLLIVTPEDAVLVKSVKDSGGMMELGLRSPLDTKPFDAAPASARNITSVFTGKNTR